LFLSLFLPILYMSSIVKPGKGVVKHAGNAGAEELIPLKDAMQRRQIEKEHDPNAEMPPRSPADNFRAKLKKISTK